MCSGMSYEWNKVYEGLLERWKGEEFGYEESKRMRDEGIE
jgi:hypothetical protein